MSGALRLELRPSRALAGAIIVAHSAAALAAYVTIPGLTAAVLASLLVLLGLATAWSRALLASQGSVRAVEIGGGQTVVELTSRERFGVEVAARRYVTRYVVALPLTAPFRRTLLVTADMLGPEEFRRLRIWALWNRLPSPRLSAHLSSGGVAAKQLAA